MESASMEVVLRTGTGKGAARKLRHVGKIPGVLYGEGGQSQPIRRNVTRARRGAAIVKAAPDMWKPIDVQYDIEQAKIRHKNQGRQ